MKLKKSAVHIALFPSKPRATQRRNSLQRIKDEVLRRNVRILLSPLPDHCSPFRIRRKSITNFSPRRSVTLVNRRSIHNNEAKDTKDQTAKSPNQAPITKSPRKRSRRKNEAEKLQEELQSKKYINDENIFRSRRALRTRLILTPKSPLVRVKKITRQTVKSRRLSLTSINKFLSRDVVIELEKLPTNDESFEDEAAKDPSVEPPQPELDQDVGTPRVKIPTPLDFTIVLEKLQVEPEKIYQVPSESKQRSEEHVPSSEPSAHDESGSSKVFDSCKDVPLREVRIVLEKLPDTVLPSITKPASHSTEPVTERIIGSAEKESDDSDSDTEKRRKKPTTPSKTSPAKVASPTTPAAVSKPLSTPISTPIQEPAGNVESSVKKTPKSLDIPLRRVTIVKSKFSKMSRALESPSAASPPIKVRPTSAYLFSPKPKSRTSKIDQTKTKIPWSNSSLESSISALDSPPSPPSANITSSGEQSAIPEVTQTVSPPSHIWKGTVVMPDVAKCNVMLKKVSGNCEGLDEDLNSSEKSVVDRLDCVGRIHPSLVWDYLGKIRKVGRKDILVLRFESAAEKDDELSYRELFSYLCTKNRMAVVGKTGQGVKDFYIMALDKRKSLPEVLLPLDGPGFEDSKPDLLLALLVRNRRVQEVQRTNPNIRQSHLFHPSHHQRVGSILETQKRVETKSEESPPTSQTTPLCTEVNSPLSRGQLLTQKSLASSPNPRQVLLIKSTQNVRSPKYQSNRDSGEKAPAQSPMNRGRLLMEQSLAASPNSGKEIRRSVSVGSTLNRSNSNLSSGQREPNDVSYKQKWSSAGDLLKISSQEKDQQMDVEDTSPIATPLDTSPGSRVFSNEKTCAAILSTLRITDRKKSRSTPDVKEITKSGTKPVSLSQPDLSQKLADVKIDSTKPSDPKQASLKPNFQIPKAKPNFSTTTTKIPTAPSAPLPRSGFTPSPPAKSTLTQAVLNSGTYMPSSYSAPTYARKPPTKPPVHSTNSKPPLAKQTSTSNNRPLLAKSFYSSGSQPSTIRPTFSSSSQPSSLTRPKSPLELKVIPPYTSTPTTLPSEPAQSANAHVFAKPFPVRDKDPRVAKSLPDGSQTTPNRPLQSPQPTLASLKPPPHVAAKPKPAPRPPQKSKSGGLKVAYMGSRSSNNTSFSKCLPSGPQYSPTYSKYLQNGFSRLPDAATVPPKPTRPPSPGTSSILRWSTVKPWMGTKPTSPTKASSVNLMSKAANVPAAPTAPVQAAKPVQAPTGPSGSLTSSILTSNPEYSPLCPQFDF